MKRLIILTFLALLLMTPSVNSVKAQTKGYVVPKFTFNFPAKGGDVSFGFGGNLGYWIRPYVASEIGYIRILGTGNAPNNHILEFNALLAKGFGKFLGIVVIGSGLYRITRYDLDKGWKGLLTTGIGFDLYFIPTLSLRFIFSYYSLFGHKDLITGQLGIILRF